MRTVTDWRWWVRKRPWPTSSQCILSRGEILLVWRVTVKKQALNLLSPRLLCCQLQLSYGGVAPLHFIVALLQLPPECSNGTCACTAVWWSEVRCPVGLYHHVQNGFWRSFVGDSVIRLPALLPHLKTVVRSWPASSCNGLVVLLFLPTRDKLWVDLLFLFLGVSVPSVSSLLK